MIISKDLLLSKLAELQRHHAKAVSDYTKAAADAEALNGAIQFAQHLLDVLSQPEPLVEEPKVEKTS